MSNIIEKSDQGLSEAQQTELSRLAQIVANAKASHMQSGLALGKALHEAHAVLKEERRFNAWVRECCGFSPRSAYNYLQVYRHFGDINGKIDLTAMYALVAPGVPQEAIDEVKRLASWGESIDRDRASKIIEAARREVDGAQESTVRASRGRLHDPLDEDLADFIAEAAQATDMPEVDDGDVATMPRHQAASRMFDKALDTIYRLVRKLDELNERVPNNPLRMAIMQSFEVAVDDLKLWRRSLREDEA